MTNQAEISAETRFRTLVEMLREEMAQRRTLVVAAGDLAHLGPAFDTAPLDPVAYTQMKVDDTTLMDTLAQGDAESFFKLMHNGHHQRNVCCLSPFYFTLDILGQTQGQVIAYDRCPADNQNTSFVSICGMVLE
jgi:AmmeMemoRadiSam system protein B